MDYILSWEAKIEITIHMSWCFLKGPSCLSSTPRVSSGRIRLPFHNPIHLFSTIGRCFSPNMNIYILSMEFSGLSIIMVEWFVAGSDMMQHPLSSCPWNAWSLLLSCIRLRCDPRYIIPGRRCL